jgi:hypothetical protein
MVALNQRLTIYGCVALLQILERYEKALKDKNKAAWCQGHDRTFR